MITVHVEELAIFNGAKIEAEELTYLDADHFFILAIVEYVGDTTDTNSLVFKVLYKDNKVAYLQFEDNIARTSAFETFLASGFNELQIFQEFYIGNRGFYIEKFTFDKNILHLVGEVGFTKLRFFGFEWVEALSLHNEPREDDLVKTLLNEIVCLTKKEHLVSFKIISAKRKRNSKMEYEISIPLFEGYSFIGDNYWLHAFVTKYNSNMHLIIDESTIELYPTIKKAFKSKFLPGMEVV